MSKEKNKIPVSYSNIYFDVFRKGKKKSLCIEDLRHDERKGVIQSMSIEKMEEVIDLLSENLYMAAQQINIYSLRENDY